MGLRSGVQEELFELLAVLAVLALAVFAADLPGFEAFAVLFDAPCLLAGAGFLFGALLEVKGEREMGFGGGEEMPVLFLIAGDRGLLLIVGLFRHQSVLVMLL